ncbi:MAG: hypothetical protein IKC79_01415 [Clostridia bacterium]|nr:hypothetical protein [Clostridia bacterium]
MNSLEVFQAFMKVFRVLTIIAFVMFVISFVSLIFVFFASMSPEFLEQINGILIEMDMQEFGNDVQPLLLTSAISMLGAGIATFMAMRYLKHEVQQGTPFNLDGAKELFVVAIVNIATPIAISIINGIIVACYGTTLLEEASMMTDSVLGGGLMLLAGSFAFKYGAELQQKNQENNSENIEENN